MRQKKAKTLNAPSPDLVEMDCASTQLVSPVPRDPSTLMSTLINEADSALRNALGRRGFVVESAAARVCREAGARVSLNVRVQDMDLARPDVLDNSRLEIVADGLPLFHGAQLAIDTIVVSVLKRDGTPHTRCADVAAFAGGAAAEGDHLPELGGQFGRAS